jgi:16S rRNA (guanine966-N2)-methyltransferase
VRIIAGSAKGVRLAPVPAGTRPLSDRAREGLFSSLGQAVEGASVLDLYAGTGAMGIEALSRGAVSALFVDSAPAAARTIRDNVARARLSKQGVVRRQDALRALRSNLGQFDLILADPPYRLAPEELDALIQEMAGQGVAAAGARIALTRPAQGYTPVIPLNWLLERRLSYGDAVVLVLQTP